MHGLLAKVLAYRATQSLAIIMMDSHETGRGVASALSDSRTPGLKPTLQCITLRQPDGKLRPYHELDAETEALVAQALQHQHHVLLIMIDQSKTGLIAPSLACVLGLKQRYGDRLTILVDACQLRLSPDTLSSYLKQNFFVAITGSKFLTGPAFFGRIINTRSLCTLAESQPLAEYLS
ncbi:hypothetical protein [Methylocucumis oryzae]|uniref:SRP54-type proteins GTP-binding domain-containing protein n=1 Tax=Methylocucumis oryzae TaxID=1632867 RepID=A0A0F3IJ88_9GAMM|nr:hypothetical protein [Methylocucumis oryzae]KJV06737.1 hypothetical protein VZ94_09270 [Methylocucumis oryzae]